MKSLTIEPNNLKQALEELKQLDESLGGNVPDKIRKDEEMVFHVLMVKIMPVLGRVKNDVKVTRQTFNKRAFEKFKVSYMYAGYDQITVLHDPYAVEELPEVVLPEYKKKQAEEVIRAEIKEEMDKKYEELLKQRLSEERGIVKQTADNDFNDASEKAKKEEEEAKRLNKEEHDALVAEAKDFDIERFLSEVDDFSNYQKIKAFANELNVDITTGRNVAQVKELLVNYANEKVDILKD